LPPKVRAVLLVIARLMEPERLMEGRQLDSACGTCSSAARTLALWPSNVGLLRYAAVKASFRDCASTRLALPTCANAINKSAPKIKEKRVNRSFKMLEWHS